MLLHVSGGSSKIKRLIYDVLDHCYNALSLEYNTTVYIDYTKLEDNIHGWCEYDGDDFYIKISKSLDTNTLIKTICHEMVHAKQYIKGELVAECCKRQWKGSDHSASSYSDCPWEVEAYRLEEDLFNSFIAEVNEKETQHVN